MSELTLETEGLFKLVVDDGKVGEARIISVK